MHLGTLLARLQEDGDAAMALDALGDIVLLAQVQSMGERFDETPGAYTAGAISRFAAAASDEQWLKLVAAMERNEDPARAALWQMLTWALSHDENARDDYTGPSSTSTCTCST